MEPHRIGAYRVPRIPFGRDTIRHRVYVELRRILQRLNLIPWKRHRDRGALYAYTVGRNHCLGLTIAIDIHEELRLAPASSSALSSGPD